jgi:hypothetical protein
MNRMSVMPARPRPGGRSRIANYPNPLIVNLVAHRTVGQRQMSTPSTSSLSNGISMAITLLIPAPLAERCYLIEGLMWVALHRFPLSSSTPGASWDNRVEEERIAGAAPFLPNDLTVTDEECVKADLPQNPAYEALREGKEYDDRYVVADMLAGGGLPEDYEQSLREAAAFHERQAAWDLEFEAFLAEPKAKLLSALQQGQVMGSGIEVRSGILGGLTDLKDFRWPGVPSPPGLESIWRYYPMMPPWRPITSGFWSAGQVHWNGCWAESADTAHCLIVLWTEDLLRVFPPPPPEKVSNVVKLAVTLALVDTTIGRRRGRRPYDWLSFHQEVARCIRANRLPQKMESLISQMSAWCLAAWGKSPARSTMAQQLSRYYE